MDETLNNAPCGFLSFTDEGRIAEVNGTLLRLLGFDSGELSGASMEMILTVASRIFYQTHFFPLIRLHGRADEVFMSLQAKDKRSIPMLAYAVRRGERTECIFVPVEQRQKYEGEILAAKRAAEEAVRDNKELQGTKTELEKQTQELDRKNRKAEQVNRELLQVTNILFHDLREPIRKIESFSDIILESKLSPESQLAVYKISSACGRMGQLLRALQQFVSVETVEDELAQVDLNEVIADSFRMTRSTHSDCQPCFETEQLPTIQGYRRQLHLLFTQLLDNAFKFRRPDVELRIMITGTLLQKNMFESVEGQYRYVDFIQIHFKDNGIGIPDEYQTSVFDLLKKLDIRSIQPGCGLAICKKVAENHYGSIAVIPHDEPGTMFRILLPVHQL